MNTSKTLMLAAVAALSLGMGTAMADGSAATPVAFPNSSVNTAGRSVITPRGPAFITGHVGSTDIITLPGSGAQGFLTNNGNGSSTLSVPGGIPQTVFTPR